MSERTLKVLLGAVVGLGVLWLVVSFFPRGEGGPGGPSDALVGFFDEIAPEGVSALRFTGPEGAEPVELRRVEGEWRVNGFQADSANLARFWQAMETTVVGDLVASNPENHSRMGLAADSAWTMEVEMPTGSRSLLVGNPGSRYNTAFVRLPTEDDVHVVEGGVRANVTRALNDWRNKRVASVDTADVWRIEVERDEEGFVLERSDSLWVMEDGTETNLATVKGILGEMFRLDASGFYEPGDSLSAPGGTVRALDQEGETTISLQVGSGDGDRWVRVPGDSIVYQLTSWRANRLIPGLEQVKGGG